MQRIKRVEKPQAWWDQTSRAAKTKPVKVRREPTTDITVVRLKVVAISMIRFVSLALRLSSFPSNRSS